MTVVVILVVDQNQLAAMIPVSGAILQQIVQDVAESGAQILAQAPHQLQLPHQLPVLLLRVWSSTVLILRLISKRSESLMQVDRLNGVTVAGLSLDGFV
jgi:hypothetical protein